MKKAWNLEKVMLVTNTLLKNTNSKLLINLFRPECNIFKAWSDHPVETMLHQIRGMFFLIGIHSMQGWTALTRHGITRKRSTKRSKHTRNLFRKNIQLKVVCSI